jgi:hypothetical protein
LETRKIHNLHYIGSQAFVNIEPQAKAPELMLAWEFIGSAIAGAKQI